MFKSPAPSAGQVDSFARDMECGDPQPLGDRAAAVDCIIRGGRIIDTKQQIDTLGDVAVLKGQVHALGPNLPCVANQIFKADNCLVVPGLIDCHVHAYLFATPLGINVDRFCLERGVTTVVDAGSSGGGGECDSLSQVKPSACVRCISENRDVVIGVKVRLSADVTNDGEHEFEVYRRALKAARDAKVPLMVHHTFSTVPVKKSAEVELSCPGDLQAGDVYTHTFHGFPSCIIDEVTYKILDDVWNAKHRGVLFDVGHGQGSFSWKVAEICAAENFWPDLISTDLHAGNIHGPAYDLPSVMSKFLHLGMPLTEVIRAVTSAPAAAIGWGDVIGSLQVGNTADITVLKLEDCNVSIEDSQSQQRTVAKKFIPVAVWMQGEQFPTSQPSPWPNPETMRAQLKDWERLVIRDPHKPQL